MIRLIKFPFALLALLAAAFGASAQNSTPIHNLPHTNVVSASNEIAVVVRPNQTNGTMRTTLGEMVSSLAIEFGAGGGGGVTNNPNQFLASGTTNNIRDGATITNPVVFADQGISRFRVPFWTNNVGQTGRPGLVTSNGVPIIHLRYTNDPSGIRHSKIYIGSENFGEEDKRWEDVQILVPSRLDNVSDENYVGFTMNFDDSDAWKFRQNRVSNYPELNILSNTPSLGLLAVGDTNADTTIYAEHARVRGTVDSWLGDHFVAVQQLFLMNGYVIISNNTQQITLDPDNNVIYSSASQFVLGANGNGGGDVALDSTARSFLPSAPWNLGTVGTQWSNVWAQTLLLSSLAKVASLHVTNVPGAGSGAIRLWQTNGQSYTEITMPDNLRVTNRFVLSIGSNTVSAGQVWKVHSTTISGGVNTVVMTNDTDNAGGGGGVNTNASQFGAAGATLTLRDQVTITNLNNIGTLHATNVPGAGSGVLRLWESNGLSYTELTAPDNLRVTNRFILSIGSNTVSAGQVWKVHSTTISGGVNTVVMTNDTDNAGGGGGINTNASQFGPAGATLTLRDQVTITNLNNIGTLHATNVPGAGSGVLRLWETNGQSYTEITAPDNLLITNRFVLSIGSNTVSAAQVLKVHSTSISGGVNTIVLTNDVDATGSGGVNTNASQFGAAGNTLTLRDQVTTTNLNNIGTLHATNIPGVGSGVLRLWESNGLSYTEITAPDNLRVTNRFILSIGSNTVSAAQVLKVHSSVISGGVNTITLTNDTDSTGAGGSPGGASGMVQMNMGGAFVGATNLLHDPTNGITTASNLVRNGYQQIPARPLVLAGTTLVADGSVGDRYTNNFASLGGTGLSTNLMVTNILEGQRVTVSGWITNGTIVTLFLDGQQPPGIWYFGGVARYLNSNGWTSVTIERNGGTTNITVDTPGLFLSVAGELTTHSNYAGGLLTISNTPYRKIPNSVSNVWNGGTFYAWSGTNVNAGVAATNLVLLSIPQHAFTNGQNVFTCEAEGGCAGVATNQFQVNWGSQTFLDSGLQTFSNCNWKITARIMGWPGTGGHTSQICSASLTISPQSGGNPTPTGAPFILTNAQGFFAFQTNGQAQAFAIATTSRKNASVTNNLVLAEFKFTPQ
jgi:hypothetical protein